MRLVSWQAAAVSGGLLAGLALGFGMYLSTKILCDWVVNYKTARGGLHLHDDK